MRLNNKVVLISGGARGMGAVEANMFSNEGASIIIGDILEDEGRKVEHPPKLTEDTGKRGPGGSSHSGHGKPDKRRSQV